MGPGSRSVAARHRPRWFDPLAGSRPWRRWRGATRFLGTAFLGGKLSNFFLKMTGKFETILDTSHHFFWKTKLFPTSHGKMMGHVWKNAETLMGKWWDFPEMVFFSRQWSSSLVKFFSHGVDDQRVCIVLMVLWEKTSSSEWLMMVLKKRLFWMIYRSVHVNMDCGGKFVGTLISWWQNWPRFTFLGAWSDTFKRG